MFDYVLLSDFAHICSRICDANSLCMQPAALITFPVFAFVLFQTPVQFLCKCLDLFAVKKSSVFSKRGCAVKDVLRDVFCRRLLTTSLLQVAFCYQQFPLAT